MKCDCGNAEPKQSHKTASAEMLLYTLLFSTVLCRTKPLPQENGLALPTGIRGGKKPIEVEYLKKTGSMFFFLVIELDFKKMKAFSQFY